MFKRVVDSGQAPPALDQSSAKFVPRLACSSLCGVGVLRPASTISRHAFDARVSNRRITSKLPFGTPLKRLRAQGPGSVFPNRTLQKAAATAQGRVWPCNSSQSSLLNVKFASRPRKNKRSCKMLRIFGCPGTGCRATPPATPPRLTTDGIGTPDPNPRHLVNRCF